MKHHRWLRIVASVLALSVSIAETAVAAEKASRLRFAAKDIDYGSAISPAGEYADALLEPESFPSDRRLVVKGRILLAGGEPVAGTAVHLFPLEEKGPQLVLGVVDGALGVGNPKGETDADGRFSIAAGPLWEYSERAIVGLVVRRAPDRPFDLGILAAEDASGLHRIALSAAKSSVDLGTITLEVAPPKP